MKIKDILPPTWSPFVLPFSSEGQYQIINAFIDQELKEIREDSRNVQSGDVFVAMTCDDIVNHIRVAVRQGAALIFVEKQVLQNEQERLPSGAYIAVDNTRECLGVMASKRYPHQPQTIFAVTGTNGKSSVVSFVRQLLGALGRKAASLGTIGLEVTPDVSLAPVLAQEAQLPKLTTPGAPAMHRLLNRLSDHGIDAFAFEASSHGLDQYRLHQVGVTVAAFTNLTQDHLDYHETMENYFQAKARLFTQILKEKGTAVINAASPYAKSLELLLKGKDIHVITYGVEEQADITARAVKVHRDCLCFNLYYKDQFLCPCTLNIVGHFQLENVLCALGMIAGMLLQQDVGNEEQLVKDLIKICQYFPRLTSAKGRMQLAGVTPKGASIYVDYAHTPDALSRALDALRHHLEDEGQLVVVLGCGGNRDAMKRVQMGSIAHNKADTVIVTDDNPRDEDPQFIRAQILSGCKDGIDVPDRHQAIEYAISRLLPRDILLVAGKGHEAGQIIKDQSIPFDDVEVVRTILSNDNK